MPRYRIHRMKDTPREHFRWAIHTGGLTVVKLKDYDRSQELEAATPYSLWKTLEQESDPLRPGDLLELVQPDGSAGQLQITKYIGFEPAQWYVPEPRAEIATVSADFISSSSSPERQE